MWLSVKHSVPYLEQRHTVGHVNSCNQMNPCHYVNSYIQMNSHHHENSYIAWINTLHVNLNIVWIHTLLVRFLISGYDYLSLPSERRRWQKRYRSCPGDGNVRHHHPQSMNTHAWGLRLACDHLVQHYGCRSSCCLSKSETKNENKSAKGIWNKINSFFWINCQRSRKRTDHCAWPCCSFSWSDRTCNHPSCRRTCCFSCPCSCVKGNCGVDRLDDDSRIVDHCGCIGCFSGSPDIYDCNVDGSSIHGYVQQEVEPFSFHLAVCPWQSSQECQPPCLLLDTAQRRQSSWTGQ